MHHMTMQSEDTRELVHFPGPLREHELANMRNHLLTLYKIELALSHREFDEASRLAEHRLGLSSLGMHGAHEVAPYMPKGMQDIGMQMHRAASRLAVEVNTSAATGDMRPALAALAHVTAQCVACHVAYRLQ
ncbi:MAG TPA: hypothetical protein VNE59_07950 [Burkholderiales bacterium]|nr:hypothetical protein [Burkholderiales bacterium]